MISKAFYTFGNTKPVPVSIPVCENPINKDIFAEYRYTDGNRKHHAGMGRFAIFLINF